MSRVIPTVFSPDAPITGQDHPAVERRLQGNPRRLTRSVVESETGFSAGVWQCEVGAWKIRFAADKQEFFCVLAGKVRLHDEQGEQWLVEAGQAAVIPAGFCGVFEVVEAVTKYYVVQQGAG